MKGMPDRILDRMKAVPLQLPLMRVSGYPESGGNIAQHVSAPDPHTQYMTAAEVAAVYVTQAYLGANYATAAAIAAAYQPAPGNQDANKFWAGPTSGGAGAVSFRTIVAADIPGLDAAKVTSGQFNPERMPRGDANLVLTAKGTTTTPAYEALPTATNGKVAATGNHTITSADGTFEDVSGVAVTLPTPGTYVIIGKVRGQAAGGSGAVFISAKLRNHSAGADIADSESLIVYNGNVATLGTLIQTGLVEGRVVTTTSNVEIRLRAKKDGGGTSPSATIATDANGGTTLNYFKVNNG